MSKTTLGFGIGSMIAGTCLSYFLGPTSAIIGAILGIALIVWSVMVGSEDAGDAQLFASLYDARKMLRAPESSPVINEDSWTTWFKERKNVQEELDQLELGPKPPKVPDSATVVRFMTSAELYEVRERDRKIERKRQELKLLDEKLAPSSNDPRIYPEVEDRTVSGGFFAGTVFILRNHGGDVAHKCSIDPLALSSGRVTFGTVDTISAGGSSEVLCNVESEGVLRHRDIKTALMAEWNRRGEVTGEFSAKLTMTYEDFKKRKFETSFELVYHPILDISRRERRNEILARATPVLRIRNVEIRRISGG